MKYGLFIWLGWLMCSMAVFATDDSVAVKQRLIKQVPELKDAVVAPTPIDGVYSVQQGAFIFYTSTDVNYVLRGQLLSLSDKRNLTDAAIQAYRAQAVNRLSDEDTINFVPDTGKYNYTITVFTDVDCPYCHKLHAQLPTLLAAGVRVRYAFFPRAGVDSPTYHKAVHVWCHRDDKLLLGQVMSGSTPAKLATCVNPIKQQLVLANELGLQGTPSIVLTDGTLIPGLPPIDELIKLIKG